MLDVGVQQEEPVLPALPPALAPAAVPTPQPAVAVGPPVPALAPGFLPAQPPVPPQQPGVVAAPIPAPVVPEPAVPAVANGVALPPAPFPLWVDLPGNEEDLAHIPLVESDDEQEVIDLTGDVLPMAHAHPTVIGGHEPNHGGQPNVPSTSTQDDDLSDPDLSPRLRRSLGNPYKARFRFFD